MRLKANLVLEQWINDNATPNGETITFDISRMVKDMKSDDFAKLSAEIRKRSGKDLDFIAYMADALGDHKGPFTVEIDVDEFDRFVESGYDCSARYIVSDGWGHLFDDSGNETNTQWVYDAEDEVLVAVKLLIDQADDKWELASADDLADLEDSLKNANPDALDNPHEWGLDYADELPDWVPEQPALRM